MKFSFLKAVWSVWFSANIESGSVINQMRGYKHVNLSKAVERQIRDEINPNTTHNEACGRRPPRNRNWGIDSIMSKLTVSQDVKTGKYM